jgi:hypothetical protein
VKKPLLLIRLFKKKVGIKEGILKKEPIIFKNKAKEGEELDQTRKIAKSEIIQKELKMLLEKSLIKVKLAKSIYLMLI